LNQNHAVEFKTSKAFSLGVEIELQIIDRQSLSQHE